MRGKAPAEKTPKHLGQPKGSETGLDPNRDNQIIAEHSAALEEKEKLCKPS